MGVGPHSRTSSLRDQSFGLPHFLDRIDHEVGRGHVCVHLQ